MRDFYRVGFYQSEIDFSQLETNSEFERRIPRHGVLEFVLPGSVRHAAAALAFSTVLWVGTPVASEPRIQESTIQLQESTPSWQMSGGYQQSLIERIERIADVLPATVDRAKSWAKWNVVGDDPRLFDALVTGSPEDDAVVFEWWNESRKLTVYVYQDSASLLRVWGSNIDSEMEEGDAEDTQVVRRAWRWLLA